MKDTFVNKNVMGKEYNAKSNQTNFDTLLKQKKNQKKMTKDELEQNMFDNTAKLKAEKATLQ